MTSTSFAMVLMFVLGGVLLLGYLLLRPKRRYLLTLAISFLLLGMALALPAPFWLIPLLLALIAFVVAVGQSINETKERIRQLRSEQLEREQAFGEFLEALARKEGGSQDSDNA